MYLLANCMGALWWYHSTVSWGHHWALAAQYFSISQCAVRSAFRLREERLLYFACARRTPMLHIRRHYITIDIGTTTLSTIMRYASFEAPVARAMDILLRVPAQQIK